MNEPVVSICCLVYNHEPFLRECFEGFVMQKTNFPIEILVHDDASTDHSADIIREYTANYPDLFKPIYQTENQYSKGVKVSATFQFPRAQGKYIALCEGDDYWTDPYKLQKQVDFLETHPEYVMCSHVVDIYKQDEGVREKWGVQEEQEYSLRKLVFGPWIYHPLSVLFKRNSLDLPHYAKYKKSKDMTLFYHILSSGKGYYMADCMAIYRKHKGGVWTGASGAQRMKSNLLYYVSLYDVERSDLALAYMCQDFLSYGRKFLLNYWQISYMVLKTYTKHYGFKAGWKLFINKYLLGRDYRPWQQI